MSGHEPLSIGVVIGEAPGGFPQLTSGLINLTRHFTDRNLISDEEAILALETTLNLKRLQVAQTKKETHEHLFKDQ